MSAATWNQPKTPHKPFRILLRHLSLANSNEPFFSQTTYKYDKEGVLFFWSSQHKKKQTRKNGPPQFKIPVAAVAGQISLSLKQTLQQICQIHSGVKVSVMRDTGSKGGRAYAEPTEMDTEKIKTQRMQDAEEAFWKELAGESEYQHTASSRKGASRGEGQRGAVPGGSGGVPGGVEVGVEIQILLQD